MATNEDFGKKHKKQKLSTSSLPFLSSQNSATSVSSFTSPTPENKNDTSPFITPCIRESHYGQSLGMRSNSQMAVGLDVSNGPPDLIHCGKYFGSRSSQFLNNDFTTKKWKVSDEGYSKDDDGYVGYYHYANGVVFEKGEASIEDYICNSFGLEKNKDDYSWKKDANVDISSNNKRDIVIVYCTYNIFSKSDFRAKFKVSPPSSFKHATVNIEKSYQIIPNSLDSRNRKVYSFNLQTIKNLSSSFWEELTVSEIIRLFNHLDNPGNQVTGLVSHYFLIRSKQSIIKSVKLLVKFLNRGSLTETNPAVGSITGTGGNVDSNKKTNHYKNSIVDSLLRCCLLDASGEVGDIAVKEIKERYYSSTFYGPGEWDLIVLKILKVLGGSNKEKEFIRLIHEHVNSTNIHNTQLALILIEQVKFLISKHKYETALRIAKICIEILPLDFETWYNLALCYILIQDFRNALLVMNSIPIVSQKQRNVDIDNVAGIKDLYLETFVNRLNRNEEPISEKTFESYFPEPKVNAFEYPRYLSASKKYSLKDTLVGEGSILNIWHDLFLFNSHLRHPMSGGQFYQSPLMNSSARELSSVDPNLIKLCGPSSMKMILSSQSAGISSLSILDFNRKSTWGRCYDLLSFLIALIGWDALVRLKEKLFKSFTVVPENSKLGYIVDNNVKDNTQVVSESWFDQLFLIIYEDLRSLMLISAYDKEQHHSAIEWEMLGLLGWSVKYNMKESISALITSVMGTAALGGFDYFGTVKLLEVYDEFVLSGICDSEISVLYDDYELKFHTHKLILNLSGDVHDGFIKSLEEDYLTLDFVLLNIMKLISWNVRWYQYIPNYLIMRILTRLCTKYDQIFIRSKIRVVFEQNKYNNAFKLKNKKNKFTLSSLLGSTTPKQANVYEFLDTDTIVDYTEKLIRWIDEINLLVT